MIFKVLLLIGLVAHYSTARSIHSHGRNSAERRAEAERNPADHEPNLTEVIHEVENVRDTFMKGKKLNVQLKSNIPSR